MQAIKQAQDSRKKASTGTYRSDAEPEKEEEMGSDHDSDSMNMVESDADEISDQIYLQGNDTFPILYYHGNNNVQIGGCGYEMVAMVLLEIR